MSNPVDVPFATTWHIRDHCLCLHVQRAARMVARRFDDALRPLGLTNGQFSLLTSLNRRQSARMGPLAALLAMDRTTLTAALKPLERRGLIDVAVDPADRRNRVLTLTRSGRSLLAAAVPIWKRTHAQVERLLAGADPHVLRRDLRNLSDTAPSPSPAARQRYRGQ
jgi:DNA-binding MarR family transcriptional regulator